MISFIIIDHTTLYAYWHDKNGKRYAIGKYLKKQQNSETENHINRSKLDCNRVTKDKN